MVKKAFFVVYDFVVVLLVLCGIAHMEMSSNTDDTLFN